MDVQSNLAELRAKRGFTAAKLAAQAGISRQTIHAIEAGLYVPNTVVSLKLARILDTTVGELFQLEAECQQIDETAEAFVLGGKTSLFKGHPLRLANVNGHTVGVAHELECRGLQPTDATFLAPIRGGNGNVNAKVRLLVDGWKKPDRILLAGNDPSAALLADALARQGFELVIAYENSSRSLELLHEGLVHIAGTHLAELANGKSNLVPITKMFSKSSVAIISFAVWKEGLVVAPGNPKKINGISDLSRKDVQITNHEPGDGCRRLLDDLRAKHGIASGKVKGYDSISRGQLPAARQVFSGKVDCCIGTEASARSVGLTFLPLAEKPCHLVLRRAHLDLPPIQALMKTLALASFRRAYSSEVGTGFR
jgi:molybdate-binding protein/DNA-binding XRE family transcriptional regulator